MVQLYSMEPLNLIEVKIIGKPLLKDEQGEGTNNDWNNFILVLIDPT